MVQTAKDYWFVLSPALGLVGWFIAWCFHVNFVVEDTRADVDQIISHSEWGAAGEQGPAPPTRRAK